MGHHRSVATIARSANRTVRTYTGTDLGSFVYFSPLRAASRSKRKPYPGSLQWGPPGQKCHLLLRCFQKQVREDDEAKEGHLCVWKVNPHQDIRVAPASQSIDTATWQPDPSLFATGVALGNLQAERPTTKTVVRSGNLRSITGATMEYECAAVELCEGTFDPKCSTTVTGGCAGCTSCI